MATNSSSRETHTGPRAPLPLASPPLLLPQTPTDPAQCLPSRAASPFPSRARIRTGQGQGQAPPAVERIFTQPRLRCFLLLFLCGRPWRRYSINSSKSEKDDHRFHHDRTPLMSTPRVCRLMGGYPLSRCHHHSQRRRLLCRLDRWHRSSDSSLSGGASPRSRTERIK